MSLGHNIGSKSFVKLNGICQYPQWNFLMTDDIVFSGRVSGRVTMFYFHILYKVVGPLSPLVSCVVGVVTHTSSESNLPLPHTAEKTVSCHQQRESDQLSQSLPVCQTYCTCHMQRWANVSQENASKIGIIWGETLLLFTSCERDASKAQWASFITNQHH